MKRILLITSFVYCCIVTTIAQNINHSQVLIDLLMRDECLQAWDYKKQHNDRIAKEAELFYRYKMSGFLNRSDSSAIYLEQIFDEFPTFMINESTKLSFLNVLIGLYNETENYEKLVETYNLAEQLILTAPFSNTGDTWKEEQLVLLNNFRSEAKRKLITPKIEVIKYENGKNGEVDIQQEPFITTLAEYNGVCLRTVMDTGCGYHIFMNKIFADKCRFKQVPSSVDSLSFNGVLVRANMALVDSIRIGNVIFTDIPVFVIHDKYSLFLPDTTLTEEQRIKYDSIMSCYDAVVGLPLLKKLGSVEFDWNRNKMSLKTKPEISIVEREPNMYTVNGVLYTHLSINNIDYTGVVDTGSANTCIVLNQQFYENNYNSLPIEEAIKEKKETVGGIAVAVQSKTKFLLKPKVVFDSKVMKLKNDDVAVAWFDNNNALSLPILNSGGMGDLFVKRLGQKVKFDFVNMRIETE